MNKDFFNESEFKAIKKRVSSLFWQQVRSMWPFVLTYVVLSSAVFVGLLWFILYLLDTYVGKV